MLQYADSRSSNWGPPVGKYFLITLCQIYSKVHFTHADGKNYILILYLHTVSLQWTFSANFFSWQYCHNSNFPYNPDLAQHTEWDEGIQLTVHSAHFNTLLGYQGQIFSGCDLEYISNKVTFVPLWCKWKDVHLKNRTSFWTVLGTLWNYQHLNHHVM